MVKIWEKTSINGVITPLSDAHVSIASSAVLYGLSVYTVFPVCKTPRGFAAFRLRDHFKRLRDSARIIGINTFEQSWTEEMFIKAVRELVAANNISEDVFVRVTVHVTDLVPGTRSRDLTSMLSIFIYEARPIVPQDGARLKTSVWRRIPDYAIPSRAKVNGAYVNSVLAKQDALDSGYDDCIFLDVQGHVCELSAANIFIVRGNTLITPDTGSDILEGINRRTIIEVARDMNISVVERSVDLTELYVADEIFACGTSSFIAPITEVDKRRVGVVAMGPITSIFRKKHTDILHGQDGDYEHLLTLLEPISTGAMKTTTGATN